MKVLQINSVCGVGSTGRIANDIASKLREHNIESYIAYGRESSIKGENILKIGSKHDYYIHGVLTRMFDNHALVGSVRATCNLVNHIIKLDPDIIHLHNIHGYYLNVKILFEYLKKSGKPVVWTLHDCWSFTGHCAYFSYVQCDKWIDGCHNCPQLKSYPASAFLDNSRRNYKIKKQLFSSMDNLTIITPSKWLADLVGKSFLGQYPIKVIPNGVDTNIFKPVDGKSIRRKYNLEHKFVILGVASVWDKRKGLNYFMELANLLEEDCVIMVVGLTEKQITTLPDNIIGIKRTANIYELTEIYSTADVFVNPTLEDNFPTTNLEALACGTPVITFDTGGSPEAIDDSCGYVVKIGNSDDVKKFIDQMKSLGKNGYSYNCVNRVRDRFDKNDRFDEYITLYDQLV